MEAKPNGQARPKAKGKGYANNGAALSNPATRKKAKASLMARNKLRIPLRNKYGGTLVDYYPKYIARTIALKKIPLSEVSPDLVPKDFDPEGGVSFSLDAIPARPVKGSGTGNYIRKAKATGLPNPNEAVMLRVLDILEKGKLKEASEARLIEVLEKLA